MQRLLPTLTKVTVVDSHQLITLPLSTTVLGQYTMVISLRTIYLSVYLSTCLSISLSAYLSIPLSRAPLWSSGSMLDHRSHYHPCLNLGVGISEGCFIFDFASLSLEVARPI